MTVSVLIPCRPDGGPRDRLWAWLRQRYQVFFPDWEICVSDDCSGVGAFNRGQARNRAAAHASGDIYVVGDADTAFDPQSLAAAVADATVSGDWLVPHTYHQLSKEQTAALLQREVIAPISPYQPDWTGVGVSVAPILVVPAAAFQAAGGYDERYPAWGSDDKAFQIILDTLYRPYRRWSGEVFHLWHPRAETLDSGSELTLRYLAAHGNRAAVLALRAEAPPSP